MILLPDPLSLDLTAGSWHDQSLELSLVLRRPGTIIQFELGTRSGALGRESREFSESDDSSSGTQRSVVAGSGVGPVGSPNLGVSHSSGVCRSWRAVVE
jgi:hypothetical protein